MNIFTFQDEFFVQIVPVRPYGLSDIAVFKTDLPYPS